MKSKIHIPKSFFSFLVASFFFWSFINLSKKYTTTINYSITYKKLAQHKIFEEKPIEEIPLRIHGTGFKLIAANFSTRNINLQADKLKIKGNGVNFFLPNAQSDYIQNQLKLGLEFKEALLDTIDLHLGSLATKKVPVLPSTNIKFDLGYDYANSIKVIPDSILISGPDLQLNAIRELKTKEIVFDNLSTSKKFKIDIEDVANEVKISEDHVAIEITVDKFTEGEFSVPFEIEDLPYGTKINTYPNKVKLVYKVRLGDFKAVTPELFKVVCDYRASKENDLSYLIPKIAIKPEMVKSVRLSPNKIDFLIQQ